LASTRESDLAERRALLELLRIYLEKHYKIRIASMSRLDSGVYLVDRKDGPKWVARVFAKERAVERVQGDAKVLQFLEKNEFPAERCANSNPVSEPRARGVLVTEYVEGIVAEKNKSTLRAFGELMGRLNALPSGSSDIVREAGALHHYAMNEGSPRNELDAALSWLDDVEDRVPSQNRTLHKTLREQVEHIGDCHDLPKSLIHPDPVLKNVIATPNGLVVIDWTGAGRGPRLASLAFLIWSGALIDGKFLRQNVDAMVAGYRSHVELEENELARLVDAMRIRPYVFACWRYRHAMSKGQPPSGKEWWWPSEGLTQEIAASARIAFKN
jgi:Ser/Thr protein kinase RdoA (MazF antagonist)